MKLVFVVLAALFCISSAADVTLTANKADYQLGEPIVVQWSDSCGCHQNDDVIELWTNPPTGTYITFNGTEDGQTSGSLTLAGRNLPGSYQIQYVRTGDTGPTTTLNITVSANFTLTTKPTVVLGESIVVNYTISPWHESGDTIALFKYNETDYVNNYLQYRASLAPGQSTGSVTFDGFTNSLPKLQIVFSIAAKPEVTYANIPVIQVVSGVTLKARKESFGINDDIVIDFTAPSTHGTSNWIYLYKGNNVTDVHNYVSYQRVDDAASKGNVTFTAFKDSSKTGNYTVTYNVEGGTYIVASLPIKVSVIGETSTTTGASDSFAASTLPSLLLLSAIVFFSLF